LNRLFTVGGKAREVGETGKKFRGETFDVI
jgi:hypothetical protein